MTSALLLHFPVPVLGTDGKYAAYRRSWFAGQINGNVSLMQMLALLGNLNPARLAALRRRDVRTVYLALLHEMAERFPINEMVALRVAEEMDEEEIFAAAGQIPVAVQGLNPWEDQVAAPFAVCYVLSQPAEFEDWRSQESLTPHRPWLNVLTEGLTEENAAHSVRPPRGRRFRPEWDALPDLFNFCHARTGCAFLDYDYYSLIENGWEAYPPLNLGEIRSLERDWQRAKPLLDSIVKLMRYIERGGTKRLQLFAGALLGEREALQAITEPKPRGGTLAQVFSKD